MPQKSLITVSLKDLNFKTMLGYMPLTQGQGGKSNRHLVIVHEPILILDIKRHRLNFKYFDLKFE